VADAHRRLPYLQPHQPELAIERTEGRIRSKNFWIITISAGFVLILVISILIYRNNYHKQTLQAEKIRNLGQNLQIASLQAMVNGEEKELIHNILKHAGATQALVQIVFHETQLCITVEDNGRGMPADGSPKEGIGLRTIRERVKLLNGQIDTVSTPGQGTSVYIELDLAGAKQNSFEQ
jgi:signal transduction histidine kinase